LSDQSGDPIAKLMDAVTVGRLPPWDGETEHLPPPRGAIAAVLTFAGHNVVAADVDPDWVRASCPWGDLVAPLRPSFLSELERRTGGIAGPLDLVLLRRHEPSLASDLRLVPFRSNHPRMSRALRVRTEVGLYQTEDGCGVVAVGRGIGGRWEAGFEVDLRARGRGLGRRLAAAAVSLIPEGQSLFLQVAAGNVASLRAVLAAGFVPIGAEILFSAGENL